MTCKPLFLGAILAALCANLAQAAETKACGLTRFSDNFLSPPCRMVVSPCPSPWRDMN